MSDDKKVIFSMVGVSKQTPKGKQIIKNIYLSFYYGAKIGIIGLNGSGKSTVMKIIAGLDQSFQGDVVFSPGYSVGYLPQEPDLDPNKTVKEIVMEGVQETVDILKEYEEINMAFMDEDVMSDPEKMDKLIVRQGEVQDQIDALDAWELDSKLDRAMDALRCPPNDQKIESLSGGERRRVALCRLLLKNPDILLLDEPTNHLDAESIDWLEQKGKRLKEEEKSESKRQKVLARELEWVRMNPKARQAKSKARLANYDKMMSEDIKQKEVNLEIPIPNGPRLGTNVIEASNVQKSFGDKMLYDNLNFKLPPAGIVGIVGPNGAGKTTIFKMIMNELLPDHGTFSIGETVKLGYVDQTHKEITPEKTVFDVVSNGLDFIEIGKQKFNSRAYLSKFNFSGSDQNKKVGVLSGGERNRLHLAMTLKTEANVLLLDEPTNDIDVNTLRALEEGIQNFAGCAVVISHDRWFLDRICTHIIAFEGDSQVYSFEGSYSDYEENKRKRLGDVGPKRIKYRKLTK